MDVCDFGRHARNSMHISFVHHHASNLFFTYFRSLQSEDSPLWDYAREIFVISRNSFELYIEFKSFYSIVYVI